MKNMTSPSVITEYMNKNDFFFKKNLGQNFLKDENVARKIVEALEITPQDTVLEIGPGFGALTQFLCDEAKSVIAVEVDPFAISVLNEAFEEKTNLKIFQGDILKTDLNTLLKDAFENGGKVKAISNLPYYITSSVILKLLENTPAFSSVIVMVQKEVAERLSAKPGTKDYSSFTVLLNFYAQAQKIFEVSHTNFIPQPKVDSAVVRITPFEKPPVEVKDKEAFVKTVKAAFSMRRKTLQNCISAYFDMPKDEASKRIEAAGFSPTVRGETLSLDNFARLSDEMVQ